MQKPGKPTELGTENIGNLLRQYAIPAIIAMTASSLYNITDSIFIGHGVGALALSGLAITFPIMNLAAAFGALVGVGASTLLSIRMGQKDYESASQILGNAIILNIIIGIVFGALFIIFLDPILYFFGASADTLPYAHDFMVVILLGNVVTHMYMGLNAILRSAGMPEKSMYATLFTVGINLILNPLFIFGFGWGIRGSAIATVISQVIMLCWQISLFRQKDNFLQFTKEGFKLKINIIKNSLSIGLSPFLMNAAGCLIVVLINQGLIRTGGDLAVGAYGIVNRVAFLFIMVVMGLNQGMQPIAGYNYGAKKYDRLIDVLKKTIKFATIIMVTGFAIVQMFPHAVASIFTNEEELINLAANGLRIVFIIYPLVGFQMVTSNFFQSIGMSGKSIFLSLTRQLIFLVPLLIFLPKFWGVDGVWYSMPIADGFSCFIAGIFLYNQFKSMRKLQSTSN